MIPPDLHPPDRSDLAALLDRYAPLRAAPLSPEIRVYQGIELMATWEAAEAMAGRTLPAPFWAYAWPGGAALARCILDDASLVRDLRVLDVGCGGGVTALAAAHAGACGVVANDIDPWALVTAEIAAERQGLTIETLGGDLTREPAGGRGFDVVTCGDLEYDRRTAPKLRALLEAARAAGARVLLADAGRPYFSDDALGRIAEFRVAVPLDLEGVTERVARVFEMR